MTEPSADEHRLSLESLCTDINSHRHLVAVTNRGPVSFKAGSDGQATPILNTGMAVNALGPLSRGMPLTWVSLASNEADLTAVRAADEGVFSGPPLPDDWSVRFAEASRRVSHRHYNLVCNPLLWFLHHRAWGPTHTPNIDDAAVDAWGNGHIPVTTAYADEIEREAARAEKPLLVNTRDYTLPLLPGLIRARVPEAILMHSLDVPWPGPDWWMLLPAQWRVSIFRSLLACDVLIFRSRRDLRSFEYGAAEFVHGVAREQPGQLTLGAHEVRLEVAYPGIDPDGLSETAGSSRVRSLADSLGDDSGIHTFVSVDRAEPHKNQVRSIRAFGRMLDIEPALADRTRFLLVLSPPPPHLGHYRRYVDEIKTEAKDVNRRFGGRTYRPVDLHLERNHAKALAALSLYDTLVSVPLADGGGGSAVDGPVVNQRNGNLILSETSPAAELFGEAASTVSPTDVEGLANAMIECIHARGDSSGAAASLRSIAIDMTHERSLTAELSAISGKL